MTNSQSIDTGHIILEALALTIPIGLSIFFGLKYGFVEWIKLKKTEIDSQNKRIDSLYLSNMTEHFEKLYDKKNEKLIKEFREEIDKIRKDFKENKDDLIEIFTKFK